MNRMCTVLLYCFGQIKFFLKLYVIYENGQLFISITEIYV